MRRFHQSHYVGIQPRLKLAREFEVVNRYSGYAEIQSCAWLKTVCCPGFNIVKRNGVPILMNPEAKFAAEVERCAQLIGISLHLVSDHRVMHLQGLRRLQVPPLHLSLIPKSKHFPCPGLHLTPG